MFQLLQLLDDGLFHSGEEIGAHLGISRAAVWKRIETAEQTMGITIERLKGKGYRLQQGQWLLNQELIEQGVQLPVYLYDSLGSTNQQAATLVNQQAAPLLVLAEQQTAGRGRRGRDWVSPPAQNIYLSLAWPVKSFAQLEGLSLVVGLALYRVLKSSLPNLDSGLKWPNDLLVNGKKCAGILLEIVGDPSDKCHVIIGVGINVNMQQATIEQAWTSLREANQQQVIGRNQLLVSFVNQLKSVLEQHLAQGFAVFREEWQAASAWQEQWVEVSTATQTIKGQMLGVAENGGLVLRLAGGQQQTFSGGEISLRKQHDS